MAKSLIVVESPAKARTLTKYLGRQYAVKASVGHIKDLPKSELGVQVNRGFQPTYVVIKGKQKVLAEIKKAAATAERVFLATDPDREGEAIAFHIAEELNGKRKRVYRVLFHEITEPAVKRALTHPGAINRHLVDAQQARRILDRIVGYQLSPLLWEKVRRGLSAGRVQSVAVRLICDRERAVAGFVAEEYWTITAHLEHEGVAFTARLAKRGGEDVRPRTEAEAMEVVRSLEGRPFVVAQVEKKEKRRQPLPPFITSRLQQDAARQLRWPAKKTMAVAQRLYEGVEFGVEGPVGLITYMRTDSVRVSPEAQAEARQYIESRHGAAYLPARPHVYKNKRQAQDAHEAIRPTMVARDPEQATGLLERDDASLYRLIWTRFLASQMVPAQLEATRVEFAAGDCLFVATGSVVIFPGFTTLYIEQREEGEAADEDEEARALPALTTGARLTPRALEPKQHFTQPPPRYSEALLIKELEEQGIGRPSTYHTIISTIQDRKYVAKVEGRFRPTELGTTVNDLLVQHFPDLMTIQFTAKMEEALDQVEEGTQDWVETIRGFYEPFTKSLERAQTEMRDVKREQIPTEIACERCGRKMVIKWGRHGRFLACPGYPDCRNTKPFVEEPSGQVRVVERDEPTTEVCERCGSPMVVRPGRFGRFMACSTYPTCRFTKPIPIGVTCPQPDCGGDLTEKRTRKGRTFYGCSRYPDCTYALWDRPVARPCPECGAPFLVEKVDRRRGAKVICAKKGCGYAES